MNVCYSYHTRNMHKHESEATRLHAMCSEEPAWLLTCAGFHRCSFGNVGEVIIQVWLCSSRRWGGRFGARLSCKRAGSRHRVEEGELTGWRWCECRCEKQQGWETGFLYPLDKGSWWLSNGITPDPTLAPGLLHQCSNTENFKHP